MKVTLTANGRTYALKTPAKGIPTAEVPQIEACPSCGQKPHLEESFKVAGRGIRETTHDTYVTDAHAVCCGAYVGTLRATVSTIFGIEEDERVLNGRARVY